MFRKEIGVRCNPYYDSGDYPQDINVYDSGTVYGVSYPLHMRAYDDYYESLIEDAVVQERDYQERKLARKDEIYKSTQLIEAEDELYRIMCLGKQPQPVRAVVAPTAPCPPTYHTPRLYLEEDLPYTSQWFDDVDGQVVCCSDVILRDASAFMLNYFKNK